MLWKSRVGRLQTFAAPVERLGHAGRTDREDPPAGQVVSATLRPTSGRQAVTERPYTSRLRDVSSPGTEAQTMLRFRFPVVIIDEDYRSESTSKPSFWIASASARMPRPEVFSER